MNISRPLVHSAVLAALWGTCSVVHAEQTESSSQSALDDVLVTAQKREERLQDVPVPLSVVSAEELVGKNLLHLKDYAASVPGLNVAPNAASFQFVSIRGITTASATTNPKVGILIDDVPIGASTARGGGLFVPDIDPGDLVRLEVLRGPQGTLYGASSLGGLLKYVTKDPSTNELKGQVRTGLDSVRNSNGLGYNIRGSVNIPVNETFAITASGFTREEPGYIDNAATGEKGFNDQQVHGGWLAALMRPSDNFSVRLSALFQDYQGDAPSEVSATPNAPDLQTNYLRNAGDYQKKIELYSAAVNGKLGDVSLTSVTGYSRFQPVSTMDFSTVAAYRNLAQSMYGVSGIEQYDGRDFHKFSQEVRLSAPLGEKLEWLLGAFYTRETSDQFQGMRPVDPSTGQIVGSDVSFVSLPSTYKESAGFADLTVHFTDQFNIQMGARQAHMETAVAQRWEGPYVTSVLNQTSPLIYPEKSMDATPFTYLVTPQLKLSSEFMLYARLASGYGSGGINVAPGAPSQFAPDKTQNYEIGVKAEFLDGVLTLDASVYHIDYKDIQLSLRDVAAALTYTGNGGEAKSEGVELSMSVGPMEGFTINGWISYDDAVLTEAFPAGTTAFGVAGSRLPNTSRFSSYLSLDRSFPLTEKLTGSVGGAVSYVGERFGPFTATSARQVLPAYAKTDLHATAEYQSWTFNLFVDNLTDRRGVLFGDVRGSVPVFFEIQPRTIGVSLGKSF